MVADRLRIVMSSIIRCRSGVIGRCALRLLMGCSVTVETKASTPTILTDKDAPLTASTLRGSGSVQSVFAADAHEPNYPVQTTSVPTLTFGSRI